VFFASVLLALATLCVDLGRPAVSSAAPITKIPDDSGPDDIFDVDPDLDPDPDLPPPPPALIVVPGSASEHLRVTVNLGPMPYKLYKRVDQGPEALFRSFANEGARTVTIYDRDVTPGRTYWYRLVNGSTGIVVGVIRRLPFARVQFEGLAITETETRRVLEAFDWRRTEPLNEGPADEPALYYMNVLVRDPLQSAGLRSFGVHVQSSPLLPQETAVWESASDAVVEDGIPVGYWQYAVVPGALYNKIREGSQALLARGEEPVVRAMVFRKLPDPDARDPITDLSRASYEYLAGHGFEYNGYDGERAGECESGADGCPYVLGEFYHHVLRPVATFARDRVRDVRRALGRFQQLVYGDVDVSLEIVVHNTDPTYPAGSEMVSGWNGRALKLQGRELFVKQGIGMVKTPPTDQAGRTTAGIAKGLPFQVCVDLENDYVEVFNLLLTSTVCSQSYSIPSSRRQRVVLRHPHLNAFMGMTDAARYVAEVADFEMEQVKVLVGPATSIPGKIQTIAGQPEPRSFAPCQGRFPGTLAAAGESLSLAIQAPHLLALVAAADVLTAVDIILMSNDDESRATAVHEYGHTVLCEMIRATGGQASHSTAWTEAIFHAFAQGPDKEAGYINEAFADLITSQVLGATNYVAPEGSAFDSDRSSAYCLADRSGLPSDPALACLESNLSLRAEFTDQVGRIASILHDAFDGGPCDNASQANDGSHWVAGGLVSSGVAQPWPQRQAQALVRHQPSSALGECDDFGADEDVSLRMNQLEEVIRNWSREAGSFDLLTEDDFLGGVARTLRSRGADTASICQVFALHGTACPGVSSAVASLTLPVWLRPAAPNGGEPEVAALETEMALDGTERIAIAGHEKVDLTSAFDLTVGDWGFEVREPEGGVLAGTWRASGGRGRKLVLELDDPSVDALLEYVAAGIDAEGELRLRGAPVFQVKPRKDGRLAGKLVVRFWLELPDGSRAKGKYVARLAGELGTAP
jgi:hypothetical protein